MKELMTISRMRTFRTCIRKHRYRYDQRIRPLDTAAAARFGLLFHDGAEACRLAQMGGSAAPVAAALEAMESRWNEAEEPDPFELVRARELFYGYHHRWNGDRYEVLEVEAEFRCPLRNPHTGYPSRTFDQAGKIDAIVRDTQDGRIWVVENKTTTMDISPGSDYWARLRIDGQISLYFDGAASLGYEIAGCLYDVAKRPMQQPLSATPEENRKYTKGKPCKGCLATGQVSGRACQLCGGSTWADEPRLYANQRDRDETPEEFALRVRESIANDPEGYFQRGEVVRFGEELEEARRNVWLYTRLIRETRPHAEGLFNPGGCFSYGSACPYWNVCTGTADLNDPHLFHQSETAHPELSDAQEKERVAG